MNFIMTFGLTAALLLVFALLYYMTFYVFFPSKGEMTRAQVKNRRYNKIGFCTIVTLISFGVALIGDPAYLPAFTMAPILGIALLVALYYYRRQTPKPNTEA